MSNQEEKIAEEEVRIDPHNETSNDKPDVIISRLKKDSIELLHELKQSIIEPAFVVSRNHLEQTNNTYVKHLVSSFILGCKMFFGGSLAMLHGIFPFFAQEMPTNICEQIIEQTPDCERCDEHKKYE